MLEEYFKVILRYSYFYKVIFSFNISHIQDELSTYTSSLRYQVSKSFSIEILLHKSTLRLKASDLTDEHPFPHRWRGSSSPRKRSLITEVEFGCFLYWLSAIYLQTLDITTHMSKTEIYWQIPTWHLASNPSNHPSQYESTCPFSYFHDKFHATTMWTGQSDINYLLKAKQNITQIHESFF